MIACIEIILEGESNCFVGEIGLTEMLLRGEFKTFNGTAGPNPIFEADPTRGIDRPLLS